MIPYLHQAGLTYFNPQVEEWFPELIEIEEQAKCAASLLLFVVDSQTRAISSMVEVGYLIGEASGWGYGIGVAEVLWCHTHTARLKRKQLVVLASLFIADLIL